VKLFWKLNINFSKVIFKKKYILWADRYNLSVQKNKNWLKQGFLGVMEFEKLISRSGKVMNFYKIVTGLGKAMEMFLWVQFSNSLHFDDNVFSSES